MGDPCYFSGVFYREKKNASGSVSVQVLAKRNGTNVLIKTIGSSTEPVVIGQLKQLAQQYIDGQMGREGLGLFVVQPDDRFKTIFEKINDIRLLGPELILGKIFDEIGFHAVTDELFRHLVLSRIISPSSKLKTVRYMQEYVHEDRHVQRIYRYMDKLHSKQKQLVETISFEHTKKILGGVLSVVFYDVTTIYFEAEQEDELRATGYSKDGKNNDPQILLGLLVSTGGYPLDYEIFNGKSYEGHTMMQVINGSKARFDLPQLVVVADAGSLNKDNIDELTKTECKYILGARIKAEKDTIKAAILKLSLTNGQSATITKTDGSRLVVSYSEARAKKDLRNRQRGLAKLERSLAKGKLTKASINNRGYNKYLIMEGQIDIRIDHTKFDADACWDGLKGYMTNTDLSPEVLIGQYRELWKIKKAFRISKTDLKVRPVFHRLQRRIQAHICIWFVAYKVYKEFERQLSQRRSHITIERAIECLKTIFGVTILHPPSGLKKRMIHTNNEDQILLLKYYEVDLG